LSFPLAIHSEMNFSAANAIQSVGLAMLIKTVYSIITHVI